MDRSPGFNRPSGTLKQLATFAHPTSIADSIRMNCRRTVAAEALRPVLLYSLTSECTHADNRSLLPTDELAELG
jgi:hypothetical protein